MSDIIVRSPADTTPARTSRAVRTLALAGLAHALHDGYTSSIYVLLPVWQNQFALGYGAMAVLRALYVGSLALLQVPSTRLARRLAPRAVLALGTLLSAIGYGLAGFSGGLVGLCVALALAGAGSSTQHPLASAAVSRAYGKGARGPLGTYNFAGDVGKALLPPLLALMITVLPWRHALWIVAGLGIVVALLIQLLMPPVEQPAPAQTNSATASAYGKGKGGFGLLLAIGMLDGAAGVTFLLFLPTLLRAKGASLPTLGLALAAIFAVLFLPLPPTLILLPFLGIALNGTSSVLYGTVPELVDGEKVEHAFALFYSGTLGSSALVPVLLGTLGDWAGPSWATAVGASAALCVIPLMVLLAPRQASDTSFRDA
jgi:FSR family fosmidomycin resistance protein-like MFS transporter